MPRLEDWLFEVRRPENILRTMLIAFGGYSLVLGVFISLKFGLKEAIIISLSYFTLAPIVVMEVVEIISNRWGVGLPDWYVSREEK